LEIPVLVRVEVENDGGTIEVKQEDLFVSASSNRAGGAVLLLGRAVGQIIAALGAGSDVPLDVLIEEFSEAVVRSARPAPIPHTCDGVGCC
jgi:hypothetical protein